MRPRASAIIAAATVCVPFGVAYAVTGSLFATVPVADLRQYGGTTLDDIRSFELWRLATAQLLHAKMPHMLFNALCLLLLGSLLERAVGPVRTFLVWLIAGGIATAVSPVFIAPPWNVGTGASQAVFALAGCVLVLAPARGVERRRAFVYATVALGIGTALDLAFAGYPKPGHVTGLVLGVLFGVLYRTTDRREREAA